MKKKFLTLIFILSVLTVLIPSVYASEIIAVGNCGIENTHTFECGDNIKWTLDSDGLLTISGNGKMYEMLSYNEVPWYNLKSQIQNVVIDEGVTSIGNCAFQNCPLLTDVLLPDSLESIGYCVFERCPLLKEITIPDNVWIIDEYTFAECSSLTKIILPEKLTWISLALFENCTVLKEVVIPEAVTYISTGAFKNCASLETINIPNGITDMTLIFPDCVSLKSIYIPENVKYIHYSFTGCTSLTDIYYGGTIEQWNEISIEDDFNATPHCQVKPSVVNTPHVTLENNTYTINAELENVKCGCRLIAVLYNNGAVSGVSSKKLLPDDTTTSVTVTSDNADSARVFIWDSLSGMKPFCDGKDADFDVYNPQN